MPQESNIYSGRTAFLSAGLERLWQEEAGLASEDWEYGFDEDRVKKILDARQIIPFRDYFIRYLLILHREKMKSFLPETKEQKWLDDSARELLRQMDESLSADYAHSPKAVQELTDLVFLDFVSNRFCDKDSTKIRFLVGAKISFPVEKEEWADQTDLCRALKKKECGLDRFLAFAFGLNMNWGDISLILRKVFRRRDFDLWKPKEFLLYFTFRYANGNLFEFYQKMKEAYDDPANKPEQDAAWILPPEEFSTQSIADQMEQIVSIVKAKDHSVSLDEKGKLPEQVLRYICEYKFLIGKASDYTRTAQKEAKLLLADIIDFNKDQFVEEYAQGNLYVSYNLTRGLSITKDSTSFVKMDTETDIEKTVRAVESVHIAGRPPAKEDIQAGHVQGIQKVLVKCTVSGVRIDEDEFVGCSGKYTVVKNDKFHMRKNSRYTEETASERYAAGSIYVSYDPGVGLHIPKGEPFFKTDPETGEILKTEAVEEIEIGRSDSIEIEIPLVFEKEEEKILSPKQQLGYVPKKRVFHTSAKELQEIHNKSCFKAPTKAKIGSQVRIEGKVFAKCKPGYFVKEGTVFTVIVNGKKLHFHAKEDCQAASIQEVRVRCVEPGKEIKKNELVGGGAQFKVVKNNKISLKKHSVLQVKGKLSTYLYSAERIEPESPLNEKQMEKLSAALAGTMLSDAKLSQIQSQKAILSRNDLLTLSFLAYMSEEEACGFGESSSKKSKVRVKEFKRRTNELLTKCGFYELYAPNPYDALLVLLASSNEPMNAFRQLWSWNLFWKEEARRRRLRRRLQNIWNRRKRKRNRKKKWKME